MKKENNSQKIIIAVNAVVLLLFVVIAGNVFRSKQQVEQKTVQKNAVVQLAKVNNQGGGLILPENIGQVNTINQDSYIENALFENGVAIKYQKMPVAVYIEPGPYFDFAKKALYAWQISTGVTSFGLVKNAHSAQMTIEFVDTQFDKKQNQYMQTGTTGYEIKSGFINKSFIKILTTADGKKVHDEVIYHTLLHEIGHALGIAGHSEDGGDIMSTANSLTSSTLSNKDIKTVQMLYSGANLQQNSTLYKSAKYRQIKQMLEKMPGDYSAWLQLGDFYLEVKHYSNACKCYTYLTKLKPQEAIGYSRLGICYEKLEDFERAYENLKTAHLKNPKEPIFIYDLAAICYNHNKKGLAKEYLKNYLNSNPLAKKEEVFIKLMKSYRL